MNTLILYPENDRYVLKRIYKIFHSKNLTADALKINTSWTLDQLNVLYQTVEMYSHICIILSPNNLNELWFSGLHGFVVGAKKGAFLYFTEYDNSINHLLSNVNFGLEYSEVELYAENESFRWERVQKKEAARENLINLGFALSEDAMGETVIAGQLEIVENYIAAGFSSSARDSRGVPMLCLAIRNSHMNVIKSLINSGADINAISEDRHNSPVMDAASSGNYESVKLLVTEGAELEYKSKNGQTALILSVGHGDVEISNYLLSAGADYMTKDSLGMSAKSYASMFKYDAILQHMK